MRQFEFEENTYILTEGQYYKLLNRFDEAFAEVYPGIAAGRYIINRPCICDEFSSCEECLLHKGLYSSCGRILSYVMGVGGPVVRAVFWLGAFAVSWQLHQDVYARRLLRKVYKALRRLQYVEEDSVK